MKETALEDYIITYYSNLLTFEENLANKHYMTQQKSMDSSHKLREMLMSKWRTTNKDALKLLEGGYDNFKRKVCERVMSETPKEVFVNNCPKCGKLARTPYAKQCRFCNYDWH